ncbi:MAG: TerD family protein [Candidatus Electrothrix sp. YB6]
MNTLERGGNCIISGSGSKTDDIVVALGWHTKNRSDDFELDASAFLLKKDGTVRSDRDFIFYNQTADQENALLLDCSPQNLRHDSEFHICLSKLSEEIEKVVIVLTIYHAVERQQNFSMVDQIFIKILEKGFKGQKLVCYEVKNANREIALTLGEIYRHQDSWKFRSVGQGFNGGLDALASQFGVDIDADQEEGTESSEENIAAGLKRTRRSQQQILTEKTHALRKGIVQFIPYVQSAVEQKINESNTRMILDRMFMDIFGYKMEEIKAEQKIQGRKADYILTVDDNDVLVVEVKRAGMALRDKQIFQATSYGAYSGIKWALLTNLQIWQVYQTSCKTW